jgi:hypothetical protein
VKQKLGSWWVSKALGQVVRRSVGPRLRVIDVVASTFFIGFTGGMGSGSGDSGSYGASSGVRVRSEGEEGAASALT